MLAEIKAAHEQTTEGLRQVISELRGRAERAEGEGASLREALARERERVGRAEGEAVTLREQLRAERNQSVTQMREVEAARDAANTELAKWTAGGPLARALRALVYRRGRR